MSLIQRTFPFISAMVGNGSVAYDHDHDGRFTDLGGCTAHVRNVENDAFLLIRYMKNRLTVRNIFTFSFFCFFLPKTNTYIDTLLHQFSLSICDADSQDDEGEVRFT